MKAIISLILCLWHARASPTQNENAVLQEKKQLFPSLGGNASGPPKIATVLKTLTPEIDAKAKREVRMWGPFKITASNATHARPGFANGIKLDPNSDAISGVISQPCTDCTVLKATANLAYKDGKQVSVADGVYTHHIIVVQNGRTQLMNPVAPPPCPGGIPGFSLIGSQVAGMTKGAGGHASGGHAGMKTKRQQIPAWMSALIPKFAVFVGGGGQVGSGSSLAVPQDVSKVRSGIYINSTDTFQFSSEIVNYDPVDKDIYLTIDFEWVPGKVDNLHDVGMGSVGLDCTSFALQPPKDKPFVYRGANWTMTDNGYFINFVPHLHDGAVKVNFFLNEKEICESKAVYGAEDGSTVLDGKKTWETITGYTPCAYMTPFKKGDHIRITGEYDLTKHTLRPMSSNHDADAEAMVLGTYYWAKAPQGN